MNLILKAIAWGANIKAQTFTILAMWAIQIRDWADKKRIQK